MKNEDKGVLNSVCIFRANEKGRLNLCKVSEVLYKQQRHL